MPDVEIRIADEFVSDAAQIHSDRLYNAVFDILWELKTIPELGSRDVPASVVSRYGGKARKLVVSPFDIFYTYDEGTGLIEVLALVHQRRVR